MRQPARLCLVAFFMVFLHCTDPAANVARGRLPQIAVLPLGDIDPFFVRKLADSLRAVTNWRVNVMAPSAIPANAFCKERNRFIADSILLFLKSRKPAGADKIMGVMGADIQTRSKRSAAWGVMGLGYCPGQACVISSFRVKKTAVSSRHFMKRMLVLARHEIGHNYGLPHCSDQKCLMQDAEGGMRLDQSFDFCKRCISDLRRHNLRMNAPVMQGYTQHTENK